MQPTTQHLSDDVPFRRTPVAGTFPLARALLVAAGWMLSVGLGLVLPPTVPFAASLDAIPAGLAAWAFGRRTALTVTTLTVLVGSTASPSGLSLGFLALAVACRWLTAAAVSELVVRTTAELSALRSAADRDPLTGIYNRRGFTARADAELRRARRYHRPVCLAYFDLDDFKRINDERGHLEGDRLLVALAQVLAHGRAGDVAGRLGGDEFALLMPETTLVAAQLALERIRGGAMLALSRNGFRVTFTVGLAAYPQAPEQVGTLLQAADARLVEGKRQRRARQRSLARHPTILADQTRLGRLVSDLRALYEQKPCMLIRFDRLSMDTLLQELFLLGQWEHAFRGEPLTARRLSRMLAQLGVKSHRWTEHDAQRGIRRQQRGYRVSDFLPLFAQPRLVEVAEARSPTASARLQGAVEAAGAAPLASATVV